VVTNDSAPSYIQARRPLPFHPAPQYSLELVRARVFSPVHSVHSSDGTSVAHPWRIQWQIRGTPNALT
jgi:hypothetical protein